MYVLLHALKVVDSSTCSVAITVGTSVGGAQTQLYTFIASGKRVLIQLIQKQSNA